MRSAAAVASFVLAVSLHAATLTVSSPLDSGPGTLRQAIQDANANFDRDQIVFTTPTVAVTSSLPYFDYPVDIDGTVGAGRVDIQGVAGETGFFFHSLIAPGAGTSTVTKVMVHGFTIPLGILGHDVIVTNGTFDDVVTVRGDDNAIRDSSLVNLSLGFGDGTVIERNVITGTIEVQDATNAHIGSAGNGNTIGPGRTGALGAIEVLAAGSLTIEGNDIHSDLPSAIHLARSVAGARITGNTIHDVVLPIDLEEALGADGPTPNDPAPDADGGANRLQNFPVLASAAAAPGSLTVTGMLTSAPSTDYVVELFSNAAPLDTFTVTTDGAGNAAFTRTFPTPAGNSITATATNQATNDTSEVSAPIVVDPSGQFSFNPTAYSVNEGDGTVTLTVVRTGGTANTVTVSYTTNDGTATSPSDYATTAGILTFGPGVTSQTISVPLVSDPIDEPAETFTVAIENDTATVTIGASAGVAGVPTLSQWGLIALALGLLVAAMLRA